VQCVGSLCDVQKPAIQFQMDYTRSPSRLCCDAQTTGICKCVEDGFVFEMLAGPNPNVARIQIQAGITIDHRLNCVPDAVLEYLPIRCFSVDNGAALFLWVLAVARLDHNRLDPGQSRRQPPLSLAHRGKSLLRFIGVVMDDEGPGVEVYHKVWIAFGETIE